MNQPNIPRRANVIDVLAEDQHPLHASEIARRLDVAPRHMVALGRVLDDLVLDGSITPLPGQRFKLGRAPRTDVRTSRDGGGAPRDGGRGRRDGGARDTRAIEGFLSANPRGFAFVANTGEGGDLFVPREAQGGALHGDRVRARIVAQSSRGLEGAIEEVLERRPDLVSGTLRMRGRSAWLEPDDARIRGPIVLDNTKPERGGEPADGLAVVARIVTFPETPDENPSGHLVEVLGPQGTLDVEARKILATHAVDEAFPPAAEAEARAYGNAVSEAALEGREDLTHLPLPTIDPTDARDHDDAVWAVRNDDGTYRVWVAIADVSTYVTEGSALDAAALARGNSIYLPNRAIPMLPRSLSSELCSLLPGVIRLCLAVEIDLDPTGLTTKARVIEGFMRSRAKLTYEGVARALGLTTIPERSEAADALVADLAVLKDVAALLRQKRTRRGALAFNVPEAKIKLDPETGVPIGIERRGGDPGVAKAYEIIEELMLLANETVADIMVSRNAPTIFRNHGAPDPVKIERFAAMCQRLGVTFDAEEALDPKKLASFVKKMHTNPRASVLDALLVRSMKQAAYDVNNIGHFGLASKAYLHFTSPIRRYPDVVVHRTLRRLARKESIDASEGAIGAMREAAARASASERRAMEIERDTQDLYRAFYMKDHVGLTYAATVGGFSASGAYASIDDPFVDVMIRTDSMGEGNYQLDDDALSMVAARSGDRVDFADVLLVRIEEVSIERRTVYARRLSTKQATDFEPEDAPRVRGKKKTRSTAERMTPSEPPSRGGRPARGAKSAGRRSKSTRVSEGPAPSKRGGSRPKAGAAKPKKKKGATKKGRR